MDLILRYGGYVVLGAFVGAFSGFFGVGGGIIVVPAHVLLAGYTQQQSQGISLAMMVPTALMGAYRYYHGKTTGLPHLAIAAVIAVGSVVAAIFGADWAQRMDPDRLRTLFALFMVAVAVRIMPSSSAASMGGLAGVLLVAIGVRLIFAR